MAAAVVAVKISLLGHVLTLLLLVAEVAVGAVVFLGSLAVFERSLLVEVLTVAFQALPGGEHAARMLHLPIKRKRRGLRVATAAEVAALQLELASDEAQAADL